MPTPFTREDLETERIQCAQEGLDLSALDADYERLLAGDLSSDADQAAAAMLLDRSASLPPVEGYGFVEPTDLAAIRAAARLPAPALPAVDNASLDARMHGAWAGRCAGCLLGKPVEGWRRKQLWGLLKAAGKWPLAGYLRSDMADAATAAEYKLDAPNTHRQLADVVDSMPEDDDINYTVTGLAVFERHGAGFTPEDVAAFWEEAIAADHQYTAERVARRNLADGIRPPRSGAYRNPFREWIGAQIRADFWGYAAPGQPELAAEYAWRDAVVSHTKNGVYGEMWAAAMVAAAFTTTDARTVLQAGLSVIPEESRLVDAIESVIEWQDVEVDYDTAVYRIHELWNEERSHDWCHTISNAMIVAVGLLWGGGDFGATICRAVQPCFDTDCNGATCGSILGAMHGYGALPQEWVAPLHGTAVTGVAGFERCSIADLAARSAACARRSMAPA